jgi:hypothetical protein
MQALLIESSVRAALIAAVIGFVLFVMRIKTASALHAVWASVVVLMLLLPAWVAWGPKASLPVLPLEAGQTTEALVALVQRVRSAQFHHPRLRFSFTLATLAASDGSLGSLNALGDQVLEAIRSAGLGDYYVNLMVMDYGPAIPGNCVVIAGVCDMGRSALQAAENVHAKYGIPMNRIELTPMIGVNDVTANVFTLDDAVLTARYVRNGRLGGLHFWSLDRDARCAPDEVPGASPVCNTHDSVPSLAYTRAFQHGIEARAELGGAGHFQNTVERR